ncbi:M14 family zinc carboxypeptidase [Amycolatopsis cihanbeyliensis]|uniref:Zinc carboxypeptidase n=1 Tax=Amycolatopsis cihanbeyliensis TaxID=1128664 RepID=A0A542DRR2_AMYCI|nr:M14 family zinc carboxypeptidase [Amycolatopsis cihanbeyliensis]TQJ05777.1 zinc carboxypeptidase [Amycolatopsis cihanbeyliensis]
MTKRTLFALLAALALGGALLATPERTGTATAAPDSRAMTGTTEGTTYVFRVPIDGPDRAQDLLRRGFDVLEQRQGDDLFVLGDAATQRKLHSAGFQAEVDSVLPEPQWEPPRKRDSNETRGASDIDETYYGGYPTVNAHYAHLDKVAADHPDLATVVTYGQSWRKANGDRRGYDLKAICITKRTGEDCQQRTDAPKPRFFLMSQVHAREITTGVMSWRWIDHLVGNYAGNAEVKSLLDTTEIWVVPIGNPDGVDIVQQNGNSPLLQRKNANTSNGNCTGTQIGIDLNRNNGSHWGESGSSSYPCAETYRGPHADSEVENRALQSLWTKLYPDRRDGGPSVPAPADTKGLMLSMHSYSDMVLFPWAYANVRTGNDSSLRSMARDMANMMGYRYGQPPEILYAASGGHDDWTYDKLGVASFTFEIGPASGSCGGFLPRYGCQDGFWNKVRPALMYAAKKAKSPYGGGSDPGDPPDCSATAWQSSQLYHPRSVVSHDGSEWRSTWYAWPGDEPGVASVWERTGPC